VVAVIGKPVFTDVARQGYRSIEFVIGGWQMRPQAAKELRRPVREKVVVLIIIGSADSDQFADAFRQRQLDNQRCREFSGRRLALAQSTTRNGHVGRARVTRPS